MKFQQQLMTGVHHRQDHQNREIQVHEIAKKRIECLKGDNIRTNTEDDCNSITSISLNSLNLGEECKDCEDEDKNILLGREHGCGWERKSIH